MADLARRRLPTLAWTVIALGAALRFAVWLRMAEAPANWLGDARIYLETTRALAHGGWFAEAWIWPPGYPILSLPLALVAGAPAALSIVSLVAGAMIPLLLFLAMRSLGHPVAGVVAAAIAAFEPEAVLASARPLSDAPAVALLVGAVALLAGAVALAASRLASGRVATFALAGFLGALATLVRPEALLGAAILPVVAATSKPSRAAAVACAVALAVALLPWVVAFHGATGSWGLSLKPQANLLKAEAYSSAVQYGDVRAAFGRTLETYRDAQGALDVRRFAHAVDVGAFFRSGEFLEHFAGHAVVGWHATPLATRVLGIVGLAGLAVAPIPRRARWLLAASALPFAAVPLFAAPLGRFLLPLLPACAWGLGTLAERALAVSRRRALALGIVAAALVAGAGLGTVGSWMRSREEMVAARAAEVEAALGEGRFDVAERKLAPALVRFRGRPEFLDLEGRLLDARNRPDDAERAFRAAVRAGGSPLALAGHLARRGRVDEAEAALAPLRASPPESADYWMLAGNLAFVANRFTEAVAAYERAEALGGPAGEIAFNRGAALLQTGDVTGALRAWEIAAREGSPATSARARAAAAELGQRR